MLQLPSGDVVIVHTHQRKIKKIDMASGTVKSVWPITANEKPLFIAYDDINDQFLLSVIETSRSA